MLFLPVNIGASSIELNKPVIECISSITTVKRFGELLDNDYALLDKGDTFNSSDYFNVIGTILSSDKQIKINTSYETLFDELIDNFDLVVKNPNIKKVKLNVNLELKTNIKHKIVL